MTDARNPSKKPAERLDIALIDSSTYFDVLTPLLDHAANLYSVSSCKHFASQRKIVISDIKYNLLAQHVIDDDKVKVQRLLIKDPTLLLHKPKTILIASSRFTWQKFYVEDVLTMTTKRGQTKMTKLLLSYYNKLAQTDEAAETYIANALSACKYNKLSYFKDRNGNDAIKIDDKYETCLLPLMKAFISENIPNNTPLDQKLSANLENLLKSFRETMLPPHAVKLNDYLDPELLLYTAHKILGENFSQFQTDEQLKHFFVKVIGFIQSLLSPNTGKELFNGVFVSHKRQNGDEILHKLSDKPFHRSTPDSCSGPGFDYFCSIASTNKNAMELSLKQLINPNAVVTSPEQLLIQRIKKKMDEFKNLTLDPSNQQQQSDALGINANTNKKYIVRNRKLLARHTESTATTPKYIIEKDGKLRINPNHLPTTSSILPSAALTIVSTVNDLVDLSGLGIFPSEKTQSSILHMQEQDYLDKFSLDEINGAKILENLTAKLAEHQIPVGLISELQALTKYQLLFLIDDNHSMNKASDPFIKDATIPMSAAAHIKDGRMTCWQEAEDRIHVMIDILANLPITITIKFLNRNNSIRLVNAGKNSVEFAKEAHEQIKKIFLNGPTQKNTSLFSKLSEELNHPEKTMYYIFTNGAYTVPAILTIQQLIMNRKNPENHPIIFISCTNEVGELKWIKEIDSSAKHVAEIDDPDSEQLEVAKNQGPAFPFSKGLWLMCQLVAAICPTLDLIDETIPFTKKSMDDLMGRKLTQEEYAEYFMSNPFAMKEFVDLYHYFSKEDLIAQQIVNFTTRKCILDMQPRKKPTQQQTRSYSASSAALFAEQAPVTKPENSERKHPNKPK